MDFGILWCVSVVSSLVTNVPFWWVMLIMGEPRQMWGKKVCGESLPLSHFCSTSKTSLKNVLMKHYLKLKLKKNYTFSLKTLRLSTLSQCYYTAIHGKWVQSSDVNDQGMTIVSYLLNSGKHCHLLKYKYFNLHLFLICKHM